MRPDDDHTLPSYGFGLTHLAKTVAQSHDRGLPSDFAAFTAKTGEYRPSVVAFTSKQGARVFARSLGEREPRFGAASWVADRPAFVLPSASAANRAPTDPPREHWWPLLAELLASGP